jgi:hypothetical protein
MGRLITEAESRYIDRNEDNIRQTGCGPATVSQIASE